MPPRKSLPDSDSESDEPLVSSRPSDQDLTDALRDVVSDMFKAGKMEELTVKRVRLAAEKALGIEEGFFRGNEVWKARSDQFIKDEVVLQESRDRGSGEPEEETEDRKSSSPAKTKRAEPEAPKPRKRQKVETPEDEDEAFVHEEEEQEDEDEEDEVKQPAKRSKGASQKPQPKPSPPKENVEDKDECVSAYKQAPQLSKEADAESQDASKSELSEVFDEEPEPSSKRQKSTERAPKKQKAATTKGKGTSKAKDADVDPDQVEIKRLQGWLIKCGIRKFWSKELVPFDTSKAKIKHLKVMLADAGMQGRYSQEKAKQIRERRELAEELEGVKEGEKQWGTGNQDEEESDGERPRRRLNRGLKSLAFLDDDDGEETD